MEVAKFIVIIAIRWMGMALIIENIHNRNNGRRGFCTKTTFNDNRVAIVKDVSILILF